jgi:hypothetical protein
MLETLLAAAAYAAPYVSGLLIVIAVISAYLNFRETRRAPYFRLRRAASIRGWRWSAVLVVSIVVLAASLRARRALPPPDMGALRPTPTPTLSPTPTSAPPTPTPEPPTPTPEPPTATSTPAPATATPTVATAAPSEATPPSETASPAITPLGEPSLAITDFSSGISPEGVPVGISTEFPAGLQRIYCWFRYSGMTGDLTWQRMLFLNRIMIREEVGEWEADESGVGYYYFTAQNGWAPGQYEARFYIGDRLADSATFTITSP